MRTTLLALGGGVWALLAVRLLLKLLAARPSNPVFALADALTAPLVAPLGLLDARQPRFGAVLELSTLALLGLLGLLLLIGALWVRRTSSARALL